MEILISSRQVRIGASMFEIALEISTSILGDSFLTARLFGRNTSFSKMEPKGLIVRVGIRHGLAELALQNRNC